MLVKLTVSSYKVSEKLRLFVCHAGLINALSLNVLQRVCKGIAAVIRQGPPADSKSCQ